jgi:four helix bundle protein
VAVRHYRDLIAWQLATQFKTEVHRLVRRSDEASNDFKYRSQLCSAADSVTSNLVEGFVRYSPAEFIRFLSYALASLAEAQSRLSDGETRGYFAETDTAIAKRLSGRVFGALLGLKRSQERYLRGR